MHDIHSGIPFDEGYKAEKKNNFCVDRYVIWIRDICWITIQIFYLYSLVFNTLLLSLFFSLRSEKLFMQMADRIAEDGFQKAGYEYVCIDVSTMLNLLVTHNLMHVELVIIIWELFCSKVRYHPYIIHWGKENIGADHWLERLVIVRQILPVGTLGNVKRTVWRLCLLMLECQGLAVSSNFNIYWLMSQDCWASHNRTLEGDLQPDPKRFPSGIKKLADYVSNKK